MQTFFSNFASFGPPVAELFEALNENTNEVGLSINQETTKYLEINAQRSNINRNTNVKTGQHNFESVQTF